MYTTYIQYHFTSIDLTYMLNTYIYIYIYMLKYHYRGYTVYTGFPLLYITIVNKLYINNVYHYFREWL